ncbi:MAG: hypothetical protein R6V06_07770 [Kiritimatiellia bacterium]
MTGKHFKYSWIAFDTLLILVIFILMGTFMRVGKLHWEREGGVGRRKGLEMRKNAVDTYRIGRTIKTAPVAYERGKVAQIARKMVFSESVELPLRPLMDIREQDETYEVRFALPGGTENEDVDVNVDGNILTLVMRHKNQACIRRIRVPCAYTQNASLNHFISNKVLYVEIATHESAGKTAGERIRIK